GFGKDFPFISHLVVGDLLVLIPEEPQKRFRGYVIDNETDIDELTLQLGANPARRWSLYQRDVTHIETEEECIEKRFHDFADTLNSFPAVDAFTQHTLKSLAECLKDFAKMSPDDAILRSVDAEFQLFRRVERKVCSPLLVRAFADVDDFIATAQTI